MAKAKRKAAGSALEWVMAIAGGIIAVGLLGLIAWEAVSGGDQGPPLVELRLERVTSTSAGYVVEIAARNRGARTAAALEIEGTLRSDGETVETSHAVLDYLPGKSRRNLGLIFTRNPARHRLEVRPTGYQEP